MSVLLDPATHHAGAHQLRIIDRGPHSSGADHGAARRPQSERVNTAANPDPGLAQQASPRVTDGDLAERYAPETNTPNGLLAQMIVRMGGAPQSIYKGMYIDQRI